MVAYHHDANAILVQPVKNRNAQTLVSAWKTLNNRFKQAEVKGEDAEVPADQQGKEGQPGPNV